MKTFGDAPIAIVLSEGHETLLHQIKDSKELSFASISSFPAITSRTTYVLLLTPGRNGKFVIGTLSSTKVIVLAGNSLEGFACEEATFLVDVLHALGVHTIIQTFISGT